jgi:hypothetical protein
LKNELFKKQAAHEKSSTTDKRKSSQSINKRVQEAALQEEKPQLRQKQKTAFLCEVSI